MKQRKLIAIILTIILTLATVLTVFAAFRFEVQFPSKLNTFTYDKSTASFKLNGNNSFTLNLSDPGSAGNFSAVVTGDKDVPEVKDDEDNVVTPGRAGTPLMYSYKLSLGEMNIEENKVLLSSVIVYLNGEIQGTLYSVMTDNLGMIGTTSYVLPNDSVTDDLRLELHLASDATPYIQNATTDGEGNVSNKNSSLTVTVNCTATNHNAQEYSFVNSTEKLIQAISEVNRGAQNKTIVLYGGVEVTTEVPAVTNPCTFDVQSATFTAPIAVNIESDPVDGVPTDIVTVLSTKSKFKTEVEGFAIEAGAIDRADSASSIDIDVGEGANHYSIQYIIDSHLESLIAHGMHAGAALDLSFKGFGCYIESVTSSDTSVLQIVSNGKALYPADIDVSKVVTATIKMITGDTHTHTVKVIGHNDAELQSLLNDELKYISDLTVAGKDVSFSIPLPTVIKSKNATIEWHSSDPEKFSSQGVCSPSANGYVTLTAVIRINEAVYTEHFKIHIATLTNKDRLEAMISAMGTITLNKLYPSTATGATSGLIAGNYSDLPLAHAVNTGYEQYFQFAIPQDGETTRQLSTFDISELTYSIDKATYSYIDLVEFTDTPAQGDTPAQTHQVVVLRQSTFNTLAEVQVTAQFKTGDSKEETSVIYVNIELGENKALGDQVLAYVRNKLSEVNVLQNMLDTRGSGEEKGDFVLPTEYSGFDIIYQVKKDTNIVTTVNVDEDKNKNIVENGEFEINAEGFKNVAHDVTVTVSVLIKGTHTISTNNVIASDDMTFTVPAAIHCDTDATVKYGFCDSTLFQSVRTQVMNQTTPAYHKTDAGFTDATKNYILVRDIENCTTLSIDGEDVSNVCLNGLAYFTNLTTFSASNFDASYAAQLARVASTYRNLTSLSLINVGLTDISPLLGLDLTKLDVSKNASLKDISGIVQYDATRLAVLNISGTAVNMDLSRSLLTAMYYRYEAANTANTQKTPKYYYTHEYTPIADGALLLEPDAISVTTESGTTTATIGGDELLINGATYDANNKKITTNSNTAISIDGKKSVSVKSGTALTVIKGEVRVSGNSVMVNDAIVSFVLTSGMTSSSFQIADLWLSGTVTISNATVSNNIITVGEGGGSLDSTIDAEYMTLTQGTIPVLSGIITKNDTAKTVTITPLKYTVDNNNDDLEDIGDYRNNGLTDNGTDTVIGHENMTRIDITGATLNGTNIIVGANGGTIKVSVTGQSTFEFAVRSNTTIQADTIGNMIMVENGVISILPINNTSPALPTTAAKVTFSDAEIYNKPSTIQVTNTNGTVSTEPISIPTIAINEGCIMTINDTLSLIIDEDTEISLPQYSVGTNANGTVIVQSYNNAQPGASYSGKKFELINFQTTQGKGLDPYQLGGFDVGTKYYHHNGWYTAVEAYGSAYIGFVYFRQANAQQTAEAVSSNVPKYLCVEGSKWIPIYTSSISLTGSKVTNESNMATWGIINHDEKTNIVSFDLKENGSYSGTINISSAFTGNTTAFTVGITTNDFTSATPQATLPTESINPIYAGIRTTLPDAKQSIAPNKVNYFGNSITIFGGTITLAKNDDGTQMYLTEGDNFILDAQSNKIPLYRVTFSYSWGAILIDGEYITVSDGATVYISGTSMQCTVSTPEQGNHSAQAAYTTDANNQKNYSDQLKVTVTDGTSTIGKGALVTTENVNVTHSTSSVTEKTTGIFSVSGGELTEVKVTYSKPGTTILAHIDNLIFEPIVANDDEKTGVNILFLLSEVPGVAHYDYPASGTIDAHGTYVQLQPTVHYGNGGLSVNVTWSVAPESMAYVQYSDYYGSPRLETKQPTSGLTYDVDGVAKQDVTVIAQVNVQGVVSTRYFTFTVTYYSN